MLVFLGGFCCLKRICQYFLGYFEQTKNAGGSCFEGISKFQIPVALIKAQPKTMWRKVLARNCHYFS